MYFNNSNNFFHGIMFHHFHDDKTHTRSQGSISGNELIKIINFIGRDNILDADIFFEKYEKKQLKNNNVCFTFDDGIKSQIDIALPVLEEYKIKSFFFVYSSLFKDKPDNLEVFRYFRTNYFKSMEDFYKNFYASLEDNIDNFFVEQKNLIDEKKNKFPHYTIDDIKFRLVRDLFLSKEQYEQTMMKMIEKKNFILDDHYSKLFFSVEDLKKIDTKGHLIGLHSHSHPVLIERLKYADQQREYKECLNILSTVLNKPKKLIKYMSHPCGSYNKDTLEILKKLGIKLGFKQIMSLEPEKGMKKINNSHLEIARQDHALIIKRLSE